jgi:UDP-N-acetylglucosamine--N-acetylmuramyl-(pentapeptide) pyrophosphoryl-undecaprenol N-acetylglucosamine transferase
MTHGRCFCFAGGGTGGHIYPAIAVAEQIAKLQPDAKIKFFISSRNVDRQILDKTGFDYTVLPALGFSLAPHRLFKFFSAFLKSYKIAKSMLLAENAPVVVGIGGFVAAPVCYAAHRLNVPLGLLNIDFVPGRANKIIGQWANRIFVQFEETAPYFSGSKAQVSVTGCPLRSTFAHLQPEKAVVELGLDKRKKILLVTGGSSGAENINEAVCMLLDKLDAFADRWQLVHLTGPANLEKIKGAYAGAEITHCVLGYYDDMPNLLAAADLVIGRSGGVSVAEYAAAQAPSICMPYPYHKDQHQYLNAGKLVEGGTAVIVDDLADAKERAEWLWEELQILLINDQQRQEMKDACALIAKKDAASEIAKLLIGEQ